MLLTLFSIALSLAIAGFAQVKGRRLFGAYAKAATRVEKMAEKLATCAVGQSLKETLAGWIDSDERISRRVARTLHRLVEKDPIRLHGRPGWALDFEHACDGKRFFRQHPGYGQVEAMPGLLTGFGILFTFAGLTVGVYGLDPTDADQLTSGVSRLLGGMSLAFLTSIAGIASALWWNWRHKQVALRFDNAFDTLSEALHQMPFLFNPEEMSYQSLEHQRAQNEALADLEDKVFRGIQRALEQSFLRELKDTVANALGGSRARGQLADALEALRQQLTRIAASAAESAELNRKISEALKERPLEAAAGAVVSPGGQAIDVRDQGKLVVETRRALANVGEIQQAQQDAAKAIQDSARELRRLMEGARAANADIIKNHQSILDHLERLDNHWTSYRKSLAAMEGAIQQSLSEFNQGIHQSLEGVHGEFDKLLAESLGRFADAMAGFDDTVKGLALTLRSEGEARKGSWLGRRGS